MKQELTFPSSGFPEPLLGPMPFSRYAEWIFSHVRELHETGQLSELQKRKERYLNGEPFEFKKDDTETSL